MMVTDIGDNFKIMVTALVVFVINIGLSPAIYFL